MHGPPAQRPCSAARHRGDALAWCSSSAPVAVQRVGAGVAARPRPRGSSHSSHLQVRHHCLVLQHARQVQRREAKLVGLIPWELPVGEELDERELVHRLDAPRREHRLQHAAVAGGAQQRVAHGVAVVAGELEVCVLVQQQANAVGGLGDGGQQQRGVAYRRAFKQRNRKWCVGTSTRGQ